MSELLKDAIEQSRVVWKSKDETDGNNIKKKYLASRDETGYVDMAINSVKYFDFVHNFQSNYNFDKDKIMLFDGNTATYVMYRYAQINNILNQASLQDNVVFDYELDVERSLCIKILEFETNLERALQTLQLNTIVKYVYEISQNFSSLWNYKNKRGKIIGSAYEQSRLLICYKLKKIYEVIFAVLGMKLLHCVI